MKEVVQECKMLHRLRHPNITQLYGLWRGYDPDLAAMRVFMVLEFCGGGTLAEAVDSRDSEVSVVTSPSGQRMCLNILGLGLSVLVPHHLVHVHLEFSFGRGGIITGLWCYRCHNVEIF